MRQCKRVREKKSVCVVVVVGGVEGRLEGSPYCRIKQRTIKCRVEVVNVSVG